MNKFYFIGITCIALTSCKMEKKPANAQPELGSRSAKIMETEGLKFKDLNKNGKLDPYEDWRLTPAERSKDLLGRMSTEEKAGMMLIADMRMFNEAFMLETSGQTETITSEFNEQDVVADKNQFTGEKLPHPVMSAVGTTKGIIQNKLRHFIWRTTTAPANALTAKKPTILVVNYSNPFVIDEIYNDQTKGHFLGVLATFGAEPEALLDVLTGKFKPHGKMPFTTPVSTKAVENNKEDLPGYMEGKGYALFLFDEGLTY